ncbi:rCG51842 [Rattus norvegicus]|uniref:RCG51842 n=1 Tax=Rattus norvegicus TaxID=10116 RepID=A6K3E4_RAT|nr:rCG51842 [Rattus norvegicus]
MGFPDSKWQPRGEHVMSSWAVKSRAVHQPVFLEGIRSPGTGATDGSEVPCGFWETNSGFPTIAISRPAAHSSPGMPLAAEGLDGDAETT